MTLILTANSLHMCTNKGLCHLYLLTHSLHKTKSVIFCVGQIYSFCLCSLCVQLKTSQTHISVKACYYLHVNIYMHCNNYSTVIIILGFCDCRRLSQIRHQKCWWKTDAYMDEDRNSRQQVAFCGPKFCRQWRTSSGTKSRTLYLLEYIQYVCVFSCIASNSLYLRASWKALTATLP